MGKIRPLNAEGQPDDEGVIGFVAISMSNATQEFSRFKQLADRSPLKSPRVVIVDCAQGGQAMAEWAPADGRPWDEARRRLAAAKLQLRQVQVAWVKLANKGPTGSFQEHGHQLERDTLAVLHNAKTQFPNLGIVYVGSRTYGGYARRLPPSTMAQAFRPDTKGKANVQTSLRLFIPVKFLLRRRRPHWHV